LIDTDRKDKYPLKKLRSEIIVKSKNLLVLVAGLLVVSLSACSSGSDQKSNNSSAEEQEPVAEVVDDEPAQEATDGESESDATSNTIATDLIGYGHYADSVYLEQVLKNMNGNQKNQYSETQLYNYARNTCNDLRAGNWKKTIDLMVGIKGTSDYEFFAQMTLLAIYAFCTESQNPFLEEAKKLGL
jgi:hypothetical protein